jgi:predicted dehydrogenase
VGFGRLARTYYLPALRACRDVRLCAVAEPLPSARDAARRLLPHTALYEDTRALLAGEPLDAVLVASPPSTHLEAWRASAARGLAVFMEKPFLLPDELARIDRRDPAWRRLMVDFNRRFWPPYRHLRDAVREGRIGCVRRAQLTLRVDLGPWSGGGDHRRREGEGGALHDLGSQLLDLAAWLLDRPPERLRATRRAGPAGAAAFELELDFPGGARAACELGYGGPTRERVRIEGEGGVLRLDDPNFLPHLERGRPRARGLARRGADLAAFAVRGLFRSRSMLRYTVRSALASFFSTLRAGGTFRPGFEDALRVATWLAIAERSLATGEPRPLADA